MTLPFYSINVWQFHILGFLPDFLQDIVCVMYKIRHIKKKCIFCVQIRFVIYSAFKFVELNPKLCLIYIIWSSMSPCERFSCWPVGLPRAIHNLTHCQSDTALKMSLAFHLTFMMYYANLNLSMVYIWRLVRMRQVRTYISSLTNYLNFLLKWDPCDI